MTVAEADVALLVGACRDRLGDPASWREPDGYPDSLAMCVLDSIWSVGINYDRHVVPVLKRYVEARGVEGLSACRDGADDLAQVLAVTTADDFATLVGSRHRTSTRNGILKAEAVQRAVQVLFDAGLVSAADARAADEAALDRARAEWLRIPGQRSGITWRYMLMLAGLEDVKPDRMIVRFVSRALDRPRPVGVEEARVLVVAAAEELGVSQRTLDHTIWNYQRSSPPRA
jgi:hypothetical protein